MIDETKPLQFGLECHTKDCMGMIAPRTEFGEQWPEQDVERFASLDGLKDEVRKRFDSRARSA